MRDCETACEKTHGDALPKRMNVFWSYSQSCIDKNVWKKIMSAFTVDIVPVDCAPPLGARASNGTTVSKFPSGAWLSVSEKHTGANNLLIITITRCSWSCCALALTLCVSIRIHCSILQQTEIDLKTKFHWVPNVSYWDTHDMGQLVQVIIVAADVLVPERL